MNGKPRFHPPLPSKRSFSEDKGLKPLACFGSPCFLLNAREYPTASPGVVGLWILVSLLLFWGCSEAGDDAGRETDGDAEVSETAEESPDGDAVEDDAEAEEEGPSTPFRFAAVSDTHIIDEYYEGPESNELDTESIFHSRERLEAAREFLNALDPPVELVVLPGDVIHNYPSPDPAFYEEHRTRFDIAKELLDGFSAPVRPALGNHDYDIPSVPRETTHDLFREKFGIEPYSAFDYKNFRFIALNNFLGDTCDPESADSNCDLGSLGQEQLDWLEAELSDGIPAFVYLHYPLSLMKRDEGGGRDLLTVLETYADTVRFVLSGHMHVWLRFETDYAAPHWVMGSTRYDPDAYLLFEADPATGDLRILNADCVEEFSYYSAPWDPETGGCASEER